MSTSDRVQGHYASTDIATRLLAAFRTVQGRDAPITPDASSRSTTFTGAACSTGAACRPHANWPRCSTHAPASGSLAPSGVDFPAPSPPSSVAKQPRSEVVAAVNVGRPNPER